MPDAQWVGNNQKSESKLSDDTMGHHSQPSFGGGILIQKKVDLHFFEKWKVGTTFFKSHQLYRKEKYASIMRQHCANRFMLSFWKIF